MNDLPPEAPRLDPVPFIVTDILLLGAAGFIVTLADAPLSSGIVVCATLLVGLGAIALLYPFVVNHARRQELALQERANQIESLARTVAATAEQIGIAVANLPSIADSSVRQLKAAEQLPAALKEQISILQQQLSATASEENAALRHELDTLRGAETAKLSAALEGLRLATADLARLEALAASHSAALDSAIAHLPRVADAFGQQTREALHRETALAVSALQTAASDAGAALEAASTEARVGFERGVRDAVAHLAKQASSNPPFPAHATYSPVIVPEPPVAPAETALIPPPPPAAPVEPPAPEPVLNIAPADQAAPATEPELAETPAAPSDTIDDAGLDEPTATTPEPSDAPAEEILEAEIPETVALEIETIEEPAPATLVAEETIAEAPATPNEEPAAEPVAEVAPTMAEPAPATDRVDEPVAPAETEPAAEEEDDTTEEPASDADPIEEEPEPAAVEPALSHDGYTRLVATAFIGIGNKLFVRGDGPGLRRDKGVPLQFVSIGKWRWESAELLFPATVKLYKNDQQECVALGEITLEPGHHHEVNATF